ncbi:MAG TPA: plasmid pRiA4b ORF-3 family protein [Verrucomicrobiae bacterium]|nr:plasmid pRiA4b ORF-3 family protein [Verrucomicrobiae bacterium]
MAENGPEGGVPLYQLKITLKWSKPQIWRRILVRQDMRLDRLHMVIQSVMPWTNSHLHQFVVGRTAPVYYGVPDPEFGGIESEELNEKRYTLADLAPAVKSKFIYEYDFGDDWLHEVVVEKVLPPDANFKHPVCLTGANACPPEDCGGMGGYYNLLEALANPNHPNHKDLTEWMGGEPWDPERFDLAETNEYLKRLKP